MTPIDPLSAIALIAAGLLLFAAGWRMGRKKRDGAERAPRRRPF